MSKKITARDKHGAELVQYRVVLGENQTAMPGDGVWISGYGLLREQAHGRFWQALVRVLSMLRMW